MAERFPNPEVEWHAESKLPDVDPTDEVTRRLGPQHDTVVGLSGGLANASIQVGADRVLRIYRRDVDALPLERSLLMRNWRYLRTPKILGDGHDFLVLEYVEHQPLENSTAHGFAVGAALAEIHQFRFNICGEIPQTGDILSNTVNKVCQPWNCFPDRVEQYIETNRSNFDVDDDLLGRCLQWFTKRRAAFESACARPVLLHGDFKASNLHWADDDRLLVLDWEFTFSGPSLMDVGQLIRWGFPQPFRNAFISGYTSNDGHLPDQWETEANCFDLVNLVGLLSKAEVGSRKASDCKRRIEETIAN